jgi:hypothetical protein
MLLMTVRSAGIVTVHPLASSDWGSGSRVAPAGIVAGIRYAGCVNRRSGAGLFVPEPRLWETFSLTRHGKLRPSDRYYD